MANIHFERKACSDDLRETLFFATGEVPVKTRQSTHVGLTTSAFDVKIVGFKNISINSVKYKSLSQARYAIQDCITKGTI